MFSYTYNRADWEIKEQKNGDDFEIWLKPVQESPERIQAMEKVIHSFDDNQIYTDVMVYKHPHHQYQIIIRPDFYAPFFLRCLEQRIIDSFAWK